MPFITLLRVPGPLGALEAVVAVAAAANAVVGLLVLGASGWRRLRLSLGTLFLLNAVAGLAWYVTGIDRPRMEQPWFASADYPTGALLVDVGVLLLGAGVWWRRLSAGLVVVSIVGFPAALLSGHHEPATIAADILAHAGFLVVFLGVSTQLTRRATPYTAAIFLAFAPRAVQFAGYVVYDAWRLLQGDPLVQVDWWRWVYLPLVLGGAAFLAARSRRRVLPLMAIAGVLGVLGVVIPWYEGTLLFFLLNLIVTRPIFTLVALAVASEEDEIGMPRDEVATRSIAAFAGALLSVVLARALDPDVPRLWEALLAAGFALVGFAAVSVVPWMRAAPPPRAPDAPPFPPGATQPERLLLTLRDVRFDPAGEAPVAATTQEVAAACGIAPKHLPEIVRRLHERSGAPLVVVDTGRVAGRDRPARRYRLTEAGARAADEVARRLLRVAEPPT